MIVCFKTTRSETFFARKISNDAGITYIPPSQFRGVT